MWLTRYDLTNIVQKSKSQNVHCNFKRVTGSIRMIKFEAITWFQAMILIIMLLVECRNCEYFEFKLQEQVVEILDSIWTWYSPMISVSTSLSTLFDIFQTFFQTWWCVLSPYEQYRQPTWYSCVPACPGSLIRYIPSMVKPKFVATLWVPKFHFYR
jgi:hypothetical protein